MVFASLHMSQYGWTIDVEFGVRSIWSNKSRCLVEDEMDYLLDSVECAKKTSWNLKFMANCSGAILPLSGWSWALVWSSSNHIDSLYSLRSLLRCILLCRGWTSSYRVAKFRGSLFCHKLWLMTCLKNPRFRSIFSSSYFSSGSLGLFFDDNEVTVSYNVLMPWFYIPRKDYACQKY